MLLLAAFLCRCCLCAGNDDERRSGMSEVQIAGIARAHRFLGSRVCQVSSGNV